MSGSVAFVIKGHGAEAALPHGQSQLGPVKRLGLALFVEGQDYGETGWIHVEANAIAQLDDEVRVVQELELAIAVRGQAMGTSDLAHRAFADAGSLGHHHRRPMGHLMQRVALGQCYHALGQLRPQGQDPRRPGLITQKTVDAIGYEALLQAPGTSLRFAGSAHARVRPDPGRRQKE